MNDGSLIRKIGPALVLATVVVGPGSLTLHTIAGANHGYDLIWVPILGTALMLAYTWTTARIAMVTQRTLFDLTRERFGGRLAGLAGVLSFAAVLAFQAGNTAAVGFASEALFGGGVRGWAIVWTVAAIGLMYLPRLYDRIEWIVKVVVGIMLLTFVATLLIVGMDIGDAVSGLRPRIVDMDAAFLSIGMLGTTFSIVAAVYQGYLIKEKGWTIDRLRLQSIDSILGIGILGIISVMILMTSAAAIHAIGGSATSAQDMAGQLEPLAGPMAFYLFTVGFFFASFSSLVVNPLIGATLLVDGLGQPARLDDKPVRMASVLGLILALVVVLLFRGSPTELIRLAQAIAVVAFPVLGFLVIANGRNRGAMGQHVTPIAVQVILIAGFCILLVIVANYVRVITGL